MSELSHLPLSAGTADPLSRLSLNTATIKRATIPEAIQVAQGVGVGALGLWRDRVDEVGLRAAATMVADAGMRVSSLCRGGFLTATDKAGQRQALDDNRRAIDECVALRTSELIMVVGGLAPGDRDIMGARERVQDRLAELVPYAREAGVRLALEALHPMYCADRAVLSTLGQANDVAEAFDPTVVGVVVDAFHLWWDPQLETEIARAGAAGRIAAYQVCDWLVPIASDALLSRGMMGDGYVDFARLSRWVTAAGYRGDIEVEIFNQSIWDADAHEVAGTVARRYLDLVQPFVG